MKMCSKHIFAWMDTLIYACFFLLLWCCHQGDCWHCERKGDQWGGIPSLSLCYSYLTMVLIFCSLLYWCWLLCGLSMTALPLSPWRQPRPVRPPLRTSRPGAGGRTRIGAGWKLTCSGCNNFTEWLGWVQNTAQIPGGQWKQQSRKPSINEIVTYTYILESAESKVWINFNQWRCQLSHGKTQCVSSKVVNIHYYFLYSITKTIHDVSTIQKMTIL